MAGSSKLVSSCPVVSHGEIFIFFCFDVFPIDFVLPAENLRQDFQKWFLRNFGGALTKTAVSAKITFVLSFWVLSKKNGVWCSCLFHFETVSQKHTVFWRKNSSDLSKMHFYLSRRNLWIKEYFEKKNKVLSFSDIGQETFRLSVEKVWQRCRNHILRVQGRCRGHWLFWTVFRFLLQISAGSGKKSDF